MKICFKSLPIGEKFTCNGSPYIKVSSRTAKTDTGHVAGAGRRFYFVSGELIVRRGATGETEKE